MRNFYDPDLKAHLTVDEKDRVRYIQHSQEYFHSDLTNPRKAAEDYLQHIGDVFKIPPDQLTHLNERVSFVAPAPQGVTYRLSEEKVLFDTITYGYYQTYHNVPIWQAGLTVTVKQNPNRILNSANNSQDDIKAKMPDAAAIERYKQVFKQAETGSMVKNARGRETGDHVTTAFLYQTLGSKARQIKTGLNRLRKLQKVSAPRIHQGRFYVYKYDAASRQDLPAKKPGGRGSKPASIETHDIHPTLPLPPVPPEIKDGKYYLVAELVFSLATQPYGLLNWRALVDVETNSILYLRALIDGVNGLVFTYDPITSTGVLTNTAASTSAVLNPLRDDVLLPSINAPVAGTQHLTGTHVTIIDDSAPTVAPPTEPAGTHFDFDARTNDFAAVNAYYHATNLFDLVEDLGFSLASYFDGTSFPVHVDHRASYSDPGGIEVNAFCSGDSTGDGIGLVGFCLGDTADTTHPIGRAVDKWVHWHEVGGHGILWDHVNSPNFGFAHSAGDGLAALQNDPESQLRALTERFRYAPFRAGLDRWFNRDVAAGWGWGGVNDTNSYNSEQILATSHFRIYRSIGGDSDDIPRRWFASRMLTYLILRAVGSLTPATNPSNVSGWVSTLQTADAGDWTSEGLAGGMYTKVIRWAFEKQGLYQPAGAPSPVTTAGAPPAVDVYIDDGRHGEYTYKWDHWNNTSVWNRNAADGLTGHQNAIQGVTNYAYVKVKNRGTSAATNVVVKGYHCKLGAGLTWPVDFDQMTPLAGLSAATIGANNTQEVILGPFEWTPNVNIYGHDCILMVASTAGDPSNVDNLSAGETVEEWRLVPNDNNVGQRNVDLVTGPESMETLVHQLQEGYIVIGNPFHRPARMEVKITLPPLLSRRGWKISFKNEPHEKFILKPGQKFKVKLQLKHGEAFTPKDIEKEKDRDITVCIYANGILMGGMTYRLTSEK